MANLEITNNASATLQVWLPIYKQDQTFAAAAAIVYPKGMLIALNTVTASYVPYVAAGADGAGTISGVLIADVDASAGAGNFPITALIGGEVRVDQLGVSDAMVGVSPAEILALQDYGIIARETTQLGELDNQ